MGLKKSQIQKATDSWRNKLYCGDNLDILREYVGDESVDLIYLDPPFNSNATYNVLFREESGDFSKAQEEAFEDTWHWGRESEATFHQVLTEGPPRVGELLAALRLFLGQNQMMAYLTMMTARLIELHRVLKATGSLYLHCDPTASHYLKILLDTVFGVRNYRNEIVWKRTNAHNMKTKTFPKGNDIILYYTKSDDFIFHHQYTAYSDAQLQRYKEDENGRLFTGVDLTYSTPSPNRQFEWRGVKPPPNRYWGFTQESLERLWEEGKILKKKNGQPRMDGLKVFLDERKGSRVGSLWDDIDRVGNTSRERVGFPTQKPTALLERIIRASTNDDAVVLDPFCGCGTAVVAAEQMGRRWIGIDRTHIAIAMIRGRLHEEAGGMKRSENAEELGGLTLIPYEVIGDPKDVASAKALANEDRFKFEWWALSLVEAKPVRDKKKGADSGIDGVIRFFDDGTGAPKQAVIQVKSGKVQASHVRDLKGVMERERAPIGALVSLEPPTKAMEQEALAAGLYTPRLGAKPVPRLQLLTIEGLLSGREQIQYHPLPPPLPKDTEPGKTPKRPPRKVDKVAAKGYEQGELPQAL